LFIYLYSLYWELRSDRSADFRA